MNMNTGRFYIPNYMGMRSIPISNPMLGSIGAVPRKIGFFNKITNGIRSVNWSGLLTNANKTLDVVNQTIPLVRQAGPMVNNMKSMLRIAKVFGNETNNRTNVNNRKIINTSNNVTFNKSNNINSKSGETRTILIDAKIDDSYPNFFV